MAFWLRDTWQIEVEEGVDEVSLALVSDAWSRTYRSGVQISSSDEVVETANGVRILPDVIGTFSESSLEDWEEKKPADSLNATLARIAEIYGQRTATIVAMQLEYPRDQ